MDSFSIVRVLFAYHFDVQFAVDGKAEAGRM